MELSALGWDEFFAEACIQKPLDWIAGRIIRKHNSGYDLMCEEGEFFARIRGRLRKDLSKSDWPAVGDWVLCSIERDYAMIERLLPRKSKISRKVSGKTSEEQVIAANADNIFLVVSLYEDFNPRKIERYLTLIAESQAQGILILNKVDCVEDAEPFLAEAKTLVNNIPILLTNALERERTCEQLSPYTDKAKTSCFVGSSGAGKSTIVNALKNEDYQAVNDIGKHKKGQHTTTSRDMIFLDNGGILIDNPGIRELRIWLDREESLAESFADIDTLSEQCRFRDCMHLTEPGCAVLQAIENGKIDPDRVENWRKLGDEAMDLLQNRQEYGRVVDNHLKQKIAKYIKHDKKKKSRHHLR